MPIQARASTQKSAAGDGRIEYARRHRRASQQLSAKSDAGSPALFCVALLLFAHNGHVKPSTDDEHNDSRKDEFTSLIASPGRPRNVNSLPCPAPAIVKTAYSDQRVPSADLLQLLRDREHPYIQESPRRSLMLHRIIDQTRKKTRTPSLFFSLTPARQNP